MTVTEQNNNYKNYKVIEYIESLRKYTKNMGNFLNGKTLKRNTYELKKNLHNNGTSNDKSDMMLDHYYVCLVNDALYDIRNNCTAWVFNTEQLKDIFRFEPNVNVRYSESDGVYYLWS